MSTIIQSLEKEQLKRRPRFIAGDRLRVHFQVIEGARRRTQIFEGVVIKRQGHGVRETFTVRKQSFGVGVERTFPLHSPKIEQLEVAAHGDVRRAKLYYLRDRVGKSARVAERRWGIAGEVIATEEDGALDAEGTTQVEAPQAVPAADGEETLEEVEVVEEDAEEATSEEGSAAAEAEGEPSTPGGGSSEPAGEPEGEAGEPGEGSGEDETSQRDA